MAKFKDVKTLREFAAAHASVDDHFGKGRNLNCRDTFKKNRSPALASGLYRWLGYLLKERF